MNQQLIDICNSVIERNTQEISRLSDVVTDTTVSIDEKTSSIAFLENQKVLLNNKISDLEKSNIGMNEIISSYLSA